MESLHISPTTSPVDWRSFYSEVTEFWLGNQKRNREARAGIRDWRNPVGEAGVSEGDDGSPGMGLCCGRAAVEEVCGPTGRSWGTVQDSRFINATDPVENIIYSDDWCAYRMLLDLDYSHHVINHSEKLLTPTTPGSIRRPLKKWVTRSGSRPQHFNQSLARYLFLRSRTSTWFYFFVLMIIKDSLCIEDVIICVMNM